ncbi:MAG: hypothetical protein IKN96_07260 [Oscillibacter sp.]|nr:hypothetical protein [Oscillibacter sp.]
MKRFWKILLLGAACASLLTGCFVEDAEMSAERIEPAPGNQAYADDSWAVYWYHCGSDLESKWGCASEDLQEMLGVDLSENVRVVVQTGGAKTWHNTQVDASKLQRYVYDSEGFYLVDEQPKGNMGDPETLSDFLRFCKGHYPAAHTMVVFWNHGGGSVGGAAYDETCRYDSLKLNELYQAFKSVYDLSVDHPPIDVVGFDTCLMATIDTAYTFCDIAKYLVASEESEPGCGWYYSGWLKALSENPGMGGAELGKVICDAFAEGCKIDGVDDEITLSVTDLSRIGALMEAYEALGQEALLNAADNPNFFPAMGRMASRAENYGGNTEDAGYTNMVDLGDLAKQCEELLPETAQAVQDALADCVVYKIRGPYREKSGGLSCYYSYDSDKEDYEGYAKIAACDAFAYLYGYAIEGELDEKGMQYLNGIGFDREELADVPTLADAGEGRDYPVYVDSGGNAVMDIGADIANLLKGVYFRLVYIDEEQDIALLLGRDNNIYMDWENGVFRDNFQGTWGAIDGHLVYMELIYEGSGYNTYMVPILLNGEKYNLRVVYDYNDACYYILGARQGLDNSGMADKNLVQLQPGDEITTIHYAATISGSDAFEPMEMDAFTVTEDTSFEEIDMGDGEFGMMFELVDARNQTTWSEMALFTVQDGTIYTETAG